MKEIMHVSQSEQQPHRPVLHLSYMLADVGSASPRAEEERVFNKLLEHRCCVSVFHPTSTKSTKPAARRVSATRHQTGFSFGFFVESRFSKICMTIVT